MERSLGQTQMVVRRVPGHLRPCTRPSSCSCGTVTSSPRRLYLCTPRPCQGAVEEGPGSRQPAARHPHNGQGDRWRATFSTGPEVAGALRPHGDRRQGTT
eukprot:2250830-Pyramimonas_sp.AAC.1